jgi:hypothetical protein
MSGGMFLFCSSLGRSTLFPFSVEMTFSDEADEAPLGVVIAVDVCLCCAQRAMAGELLNITQ